MGQCETLKYETWLNVYPKERTKYSALATVLLSRSKNQNVCFQCLKHVFHVHVFHSLIRPPKLSGCEGPYVGQLLTILGGAVPLDLAVRNKICISFIYLKEKVGGGDKNRNSYI